MSATSLDADVKTIEIEKLPEKLEFIQNIKIPEDKNPNLIFFLI